MDVIGQTIQTKLDEGLEGLGAPSGHDLKAGMLKMARAAQDHAEAALARLQNDKQTATNDYARKLEKALAAADERNGAAINRDQGAVDRLEDQLSAARATLEASRAAAAMERDTIRAEIAAERDTALALIESEMAAATEAKAMADAAREHGAKVVGGDVA